MRSIYRNLNLARKTPKIFHWSTAFPGKTKAGKLKIGGPGPKPTAIERSAMLLNPRAIIKAGKIDAIRAENKRDVALWIVGEDVFTPLPGAATAPWAGQGWKNPLTGDIHLQVRSFTVNPLLESRGGRRENTFHFCSYVMGELYVEEPVDFSEVYAVYFDSHGAVAVMK